MSVLLAAVLSYSIGFVIVLLVSPDGLPRRSVLLSLAVLGALGTVAAANLHLGFFEQKLASEIAFELWQGVSTRNFPTFLPQMVVNIPAFALLDTWHAAIGTNAALIALCVLHVHSRSPEAALHLAAPAVANFALFSLRDPLLGLLMMVFSFALLRRGRQHQSVALIGAVAIIMYWARPENLAVMVVAASAVALLRRTDVGLRVFLTPLIAVFAAFVIRFSLPLVGINVPTSVVGAPARLITFARSRATRFQGTAGGGSNILGGALPGLPTLVAYTVQLTATIVLPLPFEIRTLSLALAFTDTAFLFWIGRRFLRNSSFEARSVVFTYIGVIALFASNYGNLFRLRMLLHFIMAGAVLAEHLNRRDAVEQAAQRSDRMRDPVPIVPALTGADPIPQAQNSTPSTHL